jgi:hypothetical protein
LQDCIRERWDRKGLRMGQVVIILKTVLVKTGERNVGIYGFIRVSFRYYLGIRIK